MNPSGSPIPWGPQAVPEARGAGPSKTSCSFMRILPLPLASRRLQVQPVDSRLFSSLTSGSGLAKAEWKISEANGAAMRRPEPRTQPGSGSLRCSCPHAGQWGHVSVSVLRFSPSLPHPLRPLGSQGTTSLWPRAQPACHVTFGSLQVYLG